MKELKYLTKILSLINYIHSCVTYPQK